jgi:hypothetical protein
MILPELVSADLRTAQQNALGASSEAPPQRTAALRRKDRRRGFREDRAAGY